MKSIFLFLFMLVSTLSFAEKSTYTVPNFKEIEANIRDFDSQLYYPRLMKRFAAGDTTMNDNELTHLYYGYVYQEDYDPYRNIKHHTKPIEEMYEKEEHTKQECDTIIKYAKRVLADFPFEFRQMKLISYAYKTKGEEQEAEFWSTKMWHLLNIIRRTGDGILPESAWYVISSDHPFDVLYFQGFNPLGYTFVEPMYDFIDVSSNHEKTEGYYFNVGLMLKEYLRKQ